jgi:hypothetical protein
MYGICGICLIFGFQQKCHGMPLTSWKNNEALGQFWKISVLTKKCGRQKNAEWGFKTVSTYMDVYGSILEYSNGIVIYVKSM